MCIVLVSTAHPVYPLIVVNNRDEFLHRPTLPAAWWDPPHTHVLGGRDLQRDVHGTWLGVTRQGRIAVLTNFREGEEVVVAAVAVAGTKAPSRGELASGFLIGDGDGDAGRGNDDESDDGGGGGEAEAEAKGPIQRYARHVCKNYSRSGVGGFSLLFGLMQDCDGRKDGDVEASASSSSSGLAILFNRSPPTDGNDGDDDDDKNSTTSPTSHQTIHSLCRLATLPGETHALSNTHYTDRTWPKVLNGEKLLADVIASSSADIHNRDNNSGSGSSNNSSSSKTTRNSINNDKDTFKQTEESKDSKDSKDSKENLIDQLFSKVLSTNTLPARKKGEKLWGEYLEKLKESIFIPRIGSQTGDGDEDKHKDEKDEEKYNENNDNNDNDKNNDNDNARKKPNESSTIYYGTQKQTVILMDRARHVTFVERTLYDGWGNPLAEDEVKAGTRRFEFDIETH